MTDTKTKLLGRFSRKTMVVGMTLLVASTFFEFRGNSTIAMMAMMAALTLFGVAPSHVRDANNNGVPDGETVPPEAIDGNFARAPRSPPLPKD